ncbi:MAG TPA: VWA domain-containing protein, partial [Vicinamibacteria bacterium]
TLARVLLVLLVLALGTEPATPQAAARPPAAPQAPPPPVFGATGEVVRLDVLALDGEGRPVTGLTRDDFEVEEGGRKQEITSFEPVVVRGDRPARTEPPRLSPSRLRAPGEGRCLYVYVDDIHVQPSSLPRVRAAIRSFLETDVREGDWVTVTAPEQEVWWSARTGWEYRQLATVVDRIKGQGSGDGYADWTTVRGLEEGLPGVGGQRLVMGGASPGDAGPRPAGVPAGSQGPSDEPVAGVGKYNPTLEGEQAVALVKRRTGMTLGGLRQAIDSLVALRGHKSLVLVSEGFLLLPDMPGYREVIDVARRAHVAIHFIDPRGLETGTAAAATPTGEAPPDTSVMPGTALALPQLETEGIARVTGGHVFGPSDAEKALRRVATETGAYYLVGYSPEAARSGERKVEVRARREGVKVVARSRYFVPEPAGARARAKTEAPSPAPAAMRSLADATELPLRVSTLFFEANKKGEVATMLATEVVPGPGKKGGRLFKLVSEARARDGGPPVRDEFEGSPEVTPGVPVILARQWRLPAGVWQVRLLVEDTVAKRIGTVLHTFEVPDPKAFRLSTPILTAEIEDPDGQRKPKVALGRTFRSGGTLYCQYNVYGAQAGGKHDWAPHALGGWTLRRGDEVVRQAPPTLIQPGSDGRLTRTLGISLQGASAGE